MTGNSLKEKAMTINKSSIFMYNTNFYRVHKRVCEGVNNIDEDSCKGKIDDGHIRISQPVGIT